jgi:hypothetical protein
MPSYTVKSYQRLNPLHPPDFLVKLDPQLEPNELQREFWPLLE